MSKPKLYLLPGLGLNRQIFSRLDLNGYDIEYLDWIVPEKKESIQSYALRIAAPIKASSAPAILIGHSFGGIVAQEIADLMPIQKVILLCSIKSPAENPLRFKVLAPLGLDRYFTKELTLRTFPYWAKSFGYPDQASQQLFEKAVADQDNRYLQWALRQISRWKGSSNTLLSITHFHGDQDKTFPIRLIKDPVQIVKGGGHLMLFNQPERLSRLIKQAIQE